MDFHVQNPLAVPIQLTDVQLMCDFFGVHEGDEVLKSGDAGVGGRRRKSAFHVDPVSLLLPSRQSQRVRYNPVVVVDVCCRGRFNYARGAWSVVAVTKGSGFGPD